MLTSSQPSAQSVALYTPWTGEIMTPRSYSRKSPEVLLSIAAVAAASENW